MGAAPVTELNLAATHFAKAGRSSVDELTAQIRHSLEDPCFKVVLDAVHGYVAVLNEHRQILGANATLLEALDASGSGDPLGLRVGEALNCIHFTEGTDGCGSSPHCRTCGAVLSVLSAQAHARPQENQCRLLVRRDGQVQAIDFHVRATPLTLGDTTVTVAVFQDISALKRREVLEHVFFHDFLNTLGGITGWTEMLRSSNPEAAAREIASLAEGLKEEVLSQRTLLEAENGELAVTSSSVDVAELFARLAVVFEHHPVAQGRHLVLRPLPDRRHVHTDAVLLLRVLVNMVKNALEASPAGSAVQVWLEWDGACPSFAVHNVTVIPEQVREHIFERSYSTKARAGRGIGTYSMKLYGENYLHGTVTFSSDTAHGTTFRVTLPPEAQPGADAVAAAPAASPAGGRRILLVDDTEPLLRLGTMMLTRLGYTVTSCHSGADALAQLATATEPYAALLTDWVMDGMDGDALVEAVHRDHPGLPVVVCSGLSEGKTAGAHVRWRLGKPFTLQELKTTLDSVLAAG